jgi:transcriptional regulator with XRE-family HTH domain
MPLPRRPPELAPPHAHDREAWGLGIRAVLRRWRERANVTAQQLAERSDLDPRQLQRLEAGRGNPTLETMVKLATAMGVPTMTLVGEFEREVALARGHKPATTIRETPHFYARPTAPRPILPMGPAMTRVAKALRERRTHLRWTQDDLAHHAGISRSKVQSIESERHATTLDTLDALAQALGCDVLELMGGGA